MIMAGGAGTRLWPMSRKHTPKQLIRFIQQGTGESAAQRSLLELAAARLQGLVPPERRFVCTAEAYRAVIRRDLPVFADQQILGEPEGRDTVNAVAFGAAILAKQDPDAIFAVLTSDHIIEPDDVFRARMDLAFRLVEEDPRRLVTFSITPTYPATGFGYVERGAAIRTTDSTGPDGKPLAFRVERFVEKPDAARAQVYVQSGEFGWNSGMFVWKAAQFLNLFKRYLPESAACIQRIADAWGTPDQKSAIDREYPTLKKISVDYGVMEPVAKDIKNGDASAVICAVKMDIKWLDVGSWPSYAQTVTPDAQGNRTAGPGESLVVASKNALVVNDVPGKLVAVLGVDDLVVVQTQDAILVMPKSRSEELKTLHAQVADKLK